MIEIDITELKRPEHKELKRYTIAFCHRGETGMEEATLVGKIHQKKNGSLKVMLFNDAPKTAGDAFEARALAEQRVYELVLENLSAMSRNDIRKIKARY